MEQRDLQEHLRQLYSLAKELLTIDDYDQLLDTVAERSMGMLRAERGFLVLTQNSHLQIKVIRNWSREELTGGQEPLSSSILAEVLREEKPIVIEDALHDPRFEGKKSVQGSQLRSVLAAPLRANKAIVGVLYLETSSIADLFDEDSLQLFVEILELSSRALEVCLRRIVAEQRFTSLESDLLARYSFPGLVTQDSAFKKLLETVARVAAAEIPVLIQGESGTGKELIAKALHLNSPRAKGPLLTVNCGALAPSLLESTLFGHTKGAFTGASSNKQGMISAAHQGTMFLDEIGELPKELQAKLLRTLQFGEIQPVGATRTEIVDVRFIAATNRDLEEEVKAGRFREDLLYRLNTATLRIPPLRERSGDILPLFYYFIKSLCTKEKRQLPEISPKLERMLLRYSWPGNVRELENEARRLLALTSPGEPLTTERLSPKLQGSEEVATTSLLEQERELIELHLRLSQGNRTKAAQSLGITREGLRKKMKRYGLG